MLVALLLSLATSPTSVRAERVEAHAVPPGASGASTSSARTARGADTALDAERAFAADARTLGQWTAFRKWAAADATMFVPEPVDAQTWLKDRKDPRASVDWWPTASYVSCDGKTAVNTGGWKQPDGSVGYFTTVWQRQPDGDWRWIVDGGDRLKVPRHRPLEPAISVAACPAAGQVPDVRITNVERRAFGQGRSADGGALEWFWTVSSLSGERTLNVSLWDGRRQKMVVDDKVAAPK